MHPDIVDRRNDVYEGYDYMLPYPVTPTFNQRFKGSNPKGLLDYYGD